MKGLNEILEQHKLWLENLSTEKVSGEIADLRGADLSGANLSGANLSGAALRGADLSGANLSGANLSGANLRHANLSGANLSGADLWGANLSGAYLSDADLSGADLLGVVGNMRQVKSIQLDMWPITYTKELVQIGCQRHTIEEWKNFTEDEINRMDEYALEFWNKYKQFILTAIELSPAE